MSNNHPQGDVRLRVINCENPSPEIRKVIGDHSEVLIVTADSASGGESNLAVFAKLADNGPLAGYLASLLTQLIQADGKKRGGIQGEAAPGP